MTLWPTDVLYPLDEKSNWPVADLDWATGLTRYFFDIETFDSLTDSNRSVYNKEERYILEAITHETVHLLQLTLTGYGYRFSSNMIRIVVSAAHDFESLDAINKNRIQYAKRAERLISGMRRQGPEGVSALAIMESAAFLAQKLDHYKFGPQSYEKMLTDEAPSGEYRIAYDVAAEHLGPDATEHFPHVASLALATTQPEEAFIPLLNAFRSRASRTDIFHNHALGMRLLKADFSKSLLGTAADQVRLGNDHPVLAKIVGALSNLEQRGVLEKRVLMARGRPYNTEIATVLQWLSVFAPSATTEGRAPLRLPSDWDGFTDDDPSLQAQTLKYLFAVSQVIQQDIMDIEPAPLREPGTSPGSRQMDIPLVIRLGVITQENRTIETAERISELLDMVGRDARQVRSLRGTMAITFPDEEFPGSSPLISQEVQDFLREVFLRSPYMLYYLSDNPSASAMFEVIAAFFPNHITPQRDGSFKLGLSAELLKGVTQMILNAAAYAAGHGDSPRSVLGHLSIFPEEIGEAIRKAVLDIATRNEQASKEHTT